MYRHHYFFGVQCALPHKRRGAREEAECLATDPDRGPCPAPAAPPTVSPEPGSADEDDPGDVSGKLLN